MFRFALFAAPAFLGLLLPVETHAQVAGLRGIINSMYGVMGWGGAAPAAVSCAAGTGTGVGACELAGLFLAAVAQARWLVGGLATVIIVIAGFRLVISQSEEALTTARRTILSATIGLFVIFLSERFVDAIYGGLSAPAGTPPVYGPQILSEELLGILRYLEMFVAVVAIGLMVVQGIRVLTSFGNEEAIKKLYSSVLYTIVGILLIIFDRVIAAVFGYTTIGAMPGTPSIAPAIVELFGLLRLLLAFLAAIVIGIIVYAGALMLLHYGNEEWITRAKTILINSVIGLVLIALSFVLVSTVILAIA